MNGGAPRVSVIIPAFYSDQTIGTCLQALAVQTFQDFEVIVVNSSPEERIHQIIAAQFPQTIFRQSSTRLLPHAARNLGFSLARGELLATTDPDCLPRPDWLAFLVRACDQGHSVVQGSMELKDAGWLGRGTWLCKRFSLLSGSRNYSPWVISTCNACYTRRVWESAGPFDGELFCGDALLGWRASALGYRPWFEPRAIVESAPRDSLVELVKERYERGKEFASARAQYENWSRWRAAGFAFAFPFLLAIVLWRAFRSSLAAGWLTSFLLTLPVQIVGQLAWILGESQNYLIRAMLGSRLCEADAGRITLSKNVRFNRSDS